MWVSWTLRADAGDKQVVDSGDDHDHDEERDADGRAVAEVEPAEALLVQEESEGLALPGRPARESAHRVQQQRLGEGLQPADRRRDDGEHDDRPQRGDGDVPELLPAARAV